MSLDRAGPAAFVIASLLDVPDRARQEEVTTVAEDQVRRRLDVLVGDGGGGRERPPQGLDKRVAPQPVDETLVGQREEQLLAVGEVGHPEVDGTVRDHPARHVE